MVAAVFHSPRQTTLDATPTTSPAASLSVANPPVVKPAPIPVPRKPPYDWRELAGKVLPPIFGIALLIGIWALLTMKSTTFPTPAATFIEAVKVFSDPFYSKGPNDQGIGWNILFSLERVAVGFGLAALVGIPMGFAIGRFEVLNRALSPLISLLRPVSPLAWLPIGLLVFKAANPAAIWTIFICSIWPMIINTAVGVQRGGVGIGFWVWDEWNNLNVPHILIAILVIGVVGLLLEMLLVNIAKRFSFDET
ncbi:MAG: nitrate ABC transporter, permease protein [Pseudomonadota bacterium]